MGSRQSLLLSVWEISCGVACSVGAAWLSAQVALAYVAAPIVAEDPKVKELIRRCDQVASEDETDAGRLGEDAALRVKQQQLDLARRRLRELCKQLRARAKPAR